MKETGKRIQELRKAHGMTQKELADRIGVADLTVTSYESGRVISHTSLKKIAECFNVSADYLLGLQTDETIVLGPDLTEEEKALYRRLLYLAKKLPAPAEGE